MKKYDARLKEIRIHFNEPFYPDTIMVRTIDKKTFPLSYWGLLNLLRKRWEE